MNKSLNPLVNSQFAMIEIVFIVDFDWTIKNAHFPELCKRLPEGQTGISVGFLVLKTQVIRIMAALATSPSPIFGMTDEQFRERCQISGAPLLELKSRSDS